MLCVILFYLQTIETTVHRSINNSNVQWHSCRAKASNAIHCPVREVPKIPTVGNLWTKGSTKGSKDKINNGEFSPPNGAVIVDNVSRCFWQVSPPTTSHTDLIPVHPQALDGPEPVSEHPQYNVRLERRGRRTSPQLLDTHSFVDAVLHDQNGQEVDVSGQ